MSQSYETLLLSSPGPHVRLVTMNRPEVANALNTRMGIEFAQLFAALEEDADCRCIILTGAGERHFCAGGDLKERRGMSERAWHSQHVIFERAFAAILECPIPVIAAVNGAAFGGGLEIALGCDFIYAARNARFALSEVSLGIMPGGGGTQNLPRAVGERRAKELILSAKSFPAGEALEWGLVNALFEPGELMSRTLEMAETIAANAPLSVRQAKRAIHHGLQMSLSDGIRFEVEAYNRLVPTSDRQEGINAFNEKRRPRFTGE